MKKFRNVQGFTLVEVLVSVVVFMVVLMPALVILGKGGAVQRAETLFVGSSLMKLETEKAFFFRSKPVADTTYEISNIPWNVNQDIGDGPLHHIRIKASTKIRKVCEAEYLLFIPSLKENEADSTQTADAVKDTTK